MRLAFAKAARLIEGSSLDGDMGPNSHHETPGATNRPTVYQPDVQTDGLDPAALGGPSPMNSGQGPYGAPVATDPLLANPITPGAPIPHVQGPDLDTTTLR